MRLYELTKGQAYSKYDGRLGVRNFKSKHQAKDSPSVRRDGKFTLGTDTNRVSKGIKQVTPSLQDIGIAGRQGPWRLLDLVEVTALDTNDPKVHSRQAIGKAGASKSMLDKHVGRQLMSIEWNDDAKTLMQQSGIYIWLHPKWGIFYIGIAAKDTLKDGPHQRWTSHIQKLMGRLHTSATKDKKKDAPNVRIAYSPVEWMNFSEKFLSSKGKEIDITDEQIKKELENVSVAFYAIKPPPEGYKAALAKLEASLVKSNTRTKMNKGVDADMLANKDAVKFRKEIEKQQAQKDTTLGYMKNLDKEEEA
jgi:hypothetical protein